MPSAAIHSISVKKGWLGATSVKVGELGGGERPAIRPGGT